MKRVLVIFFMLFLITPFLCKAYEIKSEYDILTEEASGNHDAINTEDFRFEKSPINKLGRGLGNLATCWGEVIAEFFRASKEKDPAVGAGIGVVYGGYLGLYRGATALYDVATFPFPPYDKPPMLPEYAFQRIDKEADSFHARNKLFGE
ncbi:MAG: exosortase system-associated protein, TIGR04073 family [Candidatus Omnitrophica bacterium]|jgi:putative exosortase-associated protein (TIGR04073 family)|nr:exosortase system-associated protein, TIGR04073 family [Candidatus Omnitrophota bacterium]